MLTTSPAMEKGTTPQFSHPRNGMKAMSIPKMLIIPQIRLMTCIYFLQFLSYLK
jgi:hypothetical protein